MWVASAARFFSASATADFGLPLLSAFLAVLSLSVSFAGGSRSRPGLPFTSPVMWAATQYDSRVALSSSNWVRPCWSSSIARI